MHFIITFILSLFWFLYFAKVRVIAGDEGYYLYAARLYSEGLIPTLDFFYPQMPILPMIYGVWFKIFGVSWESARVLSGIIAAFCASIIFLIQEKLTSKKTAYATWLFWCLSAWSFTWIPIAKNYGLSLLFALLAILFLVLQKNNYSKTNYFLSGLFIGLASGVRLYLIALSPLFIVPLLCKGVVKKNIKKIFVSSLFLSLGIFIALLPGIYIAIKNWQTFYFDNVGYHLIRSSESTNQVKAKLNIIYQLFTSGFTSNTFSPHFQVVFLITICFVFCSLYKKTLPSLVGLAGILLTFLSIIPTPTYHQYFCLPFPFLLISSFECLSGFSKRTFKVSVLFFAIIVILPLYFEIDAARGQGGGISGKHGVFRISEIREVTDAVNSSASEQNCTSLSYWAGFYLESRCRAIQGAENHFGLQIGERLVRMNKIPNDFHVLSSMDIENVIKKTTPSVIVLSKKGGSILKLAPEMLKDFGYELVKKTNRARVYKYSEK